MDVPFFTLLLWCFRCVTKSVNVSFLFVVGALVSFSRTILCVGRAIASFTVQPMNIYMTWNDPYIEL